VNQGSTFELFMTAKKVGNLTSGRTKPKEPASTQGDILLRELSQWSAGGKPVLAVMTETRLPGTVTDGSAGLVPPGEPPLPPVDPPLPPAEPPLPPEELAALVVTVTPLVVIDVAIEDEVMQMGHKIADKSPPKSPALI
jgi:hypothetical protein